MQEVESENGL